MEKSYGDTKVLLAGVWRKQPNRHTRTPHQPSPCDRQTGPRLERASAASPSTSGSSESDATRCAAGFLGSGHGNSGSEQRNAPRSFLFPPRPSVSPPTKDDPRPRHSKEWPAVLSALAGPSHWHGAGGRLIHHHHHHFCRIDLGSMYHISLLDKTTWT